MNADTWHGVHIIFTNFYDAIVIERDKSALAIRGIIDPAAEDNPYGLKKADFDSLDRNKKHELKDFKK
jgi:hypothetical protein